MKRKNLVSRIGEKVRPLRNRILGSLSLLGLAMLYTANPIEAKIIHVPADSSTIQAGVNGAEAGDDTVKVAPGLFVENVVLKPGIVVKGSGADSTIVKDANPPDDVFSGGDSTTTIENFRIVGDTIDAGWGYFTNSGSPNFNHNVFEDLYVGILCWDHSSPKIINNTIMDCEFAGICYGDSTDPQITNNIISKSGVGIYHFGNGAPLDSTVKYNDVWGNITNYFSESDSFPDQTGINWNISEDPLFANADSGDFHLKKGSPCIGAASDSGDMGAFPYDHPNAVQERLEQLMSYKFLRVCPNPFRDVVRFSNDNGNGGSDLEVAIHDASGRYVGKANKIWNGKNYKGKKVPKGIYFATKPGYKSQKVIRH